MSTGLGKLLFCVNLIGRIALSLNYTLPLHRVSTHIQYTIIYTCLPACVRECVHVGVLAILAVRATTGYNYQCYFFVSVQEIETVYVFVCVVIVCVCVYVYVCVYLCVCVLRIGFCSQQPKLDALPCHLAMGTNCPQYEKKQNNIERESTAERPGERGGMRGQQKLEAFIDSNKLEEAVASTRQK